jgi:hypothetical protein
MSKIHHTHDRSIEHAKSREDMAHRLITPKGTVRSTRGFATAAIDNSGPVPVAVHARPALDVQPRHGGKAKGGVVTHSWGNTPQQIAQNGTRHLIKDAVDASSANPLDLMTSSQAGKRQPPCMVHDGMTRQQIAGATFDGEDILRQAAGLPKQVKED